MNKLRVERYGYYSLALLGVIYLRKINPGSNRNEDNDLATATPGMLDVNILEPKVLEKGGFQCPTCDKTFGLREDYLSHAMARHQPSFTTDESLQYLSSVQHEKGFHFFTEIGNYTGVTAISLDEFARKLDTVPVESVMFHFQRQDYQRWLIDVIGDNELAKRIDEIKETEGTSGESLRKVLSQTVQGAIENLKESAGVK